MNTQTAPIRTSPFGIAHDLRTVVVVLKRDLFRFVHDIGRTVSMLLQAGLWLFVIGVGFGSLIPRGNDGLPLTAVMFPGILVMTVISVAMASAANIVMERETGFLRGMLVAPARRSAVIIGKVLSGAIQATIQACVIMTTMGFAGIPYAPGLILTLLGLVFLVALLASAIGVLLAISVKENEAFMWLTQLVISPLVLLSGAMFPLGNLPTWLASIARVNPITYTVDPMRQAVFNHLDTSAATEATYNSGVVWFGWRVPWEIEVSLVVLACALIISLAVARFNKTD
jgi:ABC-2 type transport system permease protein